MARKKKIKGLPNLKETSSLNRRKFVQWSSLVAFTTVFFSNYSFGNIYKAITKCIPTTADILGPFYKSGAPFTTILADINEPGERLFINGTLFTSDCITPIEDALIDVWHANDSGAYDSSNNYNLRGKMKTDANGQYSFETILPGAYDIGGGQFRPKHIHVKASAQSHADLTTQLYFQGDPFIPSDPWASDPDAIDRIIPLTKDVNNNWKGEFDIILDSNTGLGKTKKLDKLGYLMQNVPNPFSDFTNINYTVFIKSKVEISIYDLKGSLIKKLVYKKMVPGRFIVKWDCSHQNGSKVSNGIYICRFLMNNKNVNNIRMLVQK